MAEKVEFKKIRDFGEIINDTFLFIKQNFKPLMKVFIYLCGFFILAAMLSAIMQQIGLQNAIRSGIGAGSDGDAALTRFAQVLTLDSLILIVFSMANYTAIYVTVISFIALYVEKGKIAPSVEEVWAYFKYYFFRVLGSSIIVGLFLICCFVACFVPFVYVFPAMSLFFPIMILENADFGYSFSRSFKLLKDQWWVSAGTIFVLWIITYASMSFASLPAIILSIFSAFTEGANGISNTVIIISTIIRYLCQIFMVLPVIGICLCYYNLNERQDNTGLLERIDKFGKPNADINPIPEEY
ncbi:hypothetical protein [Pedobacter frigoris]|uniref:Glycerophosphoryl diester phosphodiesterase membrane domain-containing protein n=1 Tax=Pedobacter frigoris TaxID=2571272 RepID=A0A4U1CL68_9SPHI|nr:hypothetical protein [Pedobacter frigoris]TKC07602.1 hypothetical protein FA047_10205 [Pedobacter frigoris]